MSLNIECRHWCVGAAPMGWDGPASVHASDACFLRQVLSAAEAEGWRAMMMLFGRSDLVPKEEPAAEHLILQQQQQQEPEVTGDIKRNMQSQLKEVTAADNVQDGKRNHQSLWIQS